MASFEHVEASFWDTTIKYGVLPSLTPDTVAAAERELGVKLPDGLLRLLRIQNGGVVSKAWNACPAEPNYYAEDHVPFEHVFGVGPTGTAGANTMLDTAYLVREWNLPTDVVLLSGEHYWIALDYRTSEHGGEPAITWIDNELGHEISARAQLPHVRRAPHAISHPRRLSRVNAALTTARHRPSLPPSARRSALTRIAAEEDARA